MTMTRRAMMAMAMIAGLTLSGCGGGEAETEPAGTASSSPSESTSQSEPVEEIGPPRAESALVVADPNVDALETTQVGDGTKGTVIVPTGSVTVQDVATVKRIPGEIVGDTGTLLPAKGEMFVLVTIEHKKAKLPEGSVAAGLGDPLLQVVRGEASEALKLPPNGRSATYLLSVPVEGESAIAVSQSGLTQKVNLADGRRVLDSVAQTYYRKTREVKPKGGLTMTPAKVELAHEGGNTKTVTLHLDASVARVSLSPWVEGRGWARAGTAWLSIDGSLSRRSSSGVLFPGQVQAKFTVEHGEEEAEAISINLPPEQSNGEVHQSVAVPVDIENITVVTTAGVEVFASDGYTVQGSSPVMFSSQPLKVDFGPPVS